MDDFVTVVGAHERLGRDKEKIVCFWCNSDRKVDIDLDIYLKLPCACVSR